MKRPPSQAKAGANPPPADVVRAAAEWRARHDAGLMAGEETRFVQWLEADERHAEIFAQMDETWHILDRASEVAPEALGAPRSMAAVPVVAVRSKRNPRFAASFAKAFAVAAAFAIMGAIGWWRAGSTSTLEFADTATVGPGLVKRLNLPDGSILRLNSGSTIKVQFTQGERRVALERGEASFAVAKNPQRPFIVTTAGVDVRAVGTIFNVVLRADSVEVLVTEGKVRVDHAARGGSLLTARAVSTAEGQPPALSAGEKVVIPVLDRTPAAGVAPVAVPAAEIARVLAWQERRLEFDSAPLSEIAAKFNRYNQHKLVVADAALGMQRFGGSFRADDPDTFVHLIETRSGVVIEQKPNETILRLAK